MWIECIIGTTHRLIVDIPTAVTWHIQSKKRRESLSGLLHLIGPRLQLQPAWFVAFKRAEAAALCLMVH
jgi:hypothetical protein